MIELVLPWAPSVNEYWHHNSRGHTYISKPGRVFRDLVGWECRAKRIKRLQGRLGLVVKACPPDRRRRDLDNVLKALADALQHAGAYDDDSQIDDLRIYRGPVFEGGALHVLILEISQQIQ